MQEFSIYFYIFNIIIIALPLAIFEIIIEKDKGWGSGWDKNKWYAKKFIPDNIIVKSLAKILKIEPPLNYHALVFGFLLPVLFIAQYIYVVNDALLLLASLVSVLVFEDMFWFIFNWNFGSFRQLLRGPEGSIWWIKGWVRIYKKYYLPKSYFIGLPISIILLVLSLL